MKITTVFYNGRKMNQKRVIPLMMRQMIEKDAPELPDFPANGNPYRYVREKISELRLRPLSENGIRNWCYEEEKSGASPTLDDFFLLIQITKSKRPLNFISRLIDENNADSQTIIYGEVFEEIGNFIEELGKQLKIKGLDYKNGKIAI